MNSRVNRYCSIGHDSHKGNAPSGTAVSTQSNVIAAPDAAFTELTMIIVNDMSDFTIREVIAIVVGEGFCRPVILDGPLQ